MRVFCAIIFFSISITLSSSQLPPRLNIPGALLVGQARPAPFRQQQRIHNDSPGPRLRRPPPNAIPAPVRPVVEEPEETPPTPESSFDDEVTKLGISALQSAVRQASAPEEEPSRPVHFRPERPIPVLRQDVRERENVPQRQQQQQLRQEVRERENQRQEQRENQRQEQRENQRQEQRENVPRPLLRQENREELGLPVRQQQPVRHQARQQIPLQQPAPQPVRQPTRGPHPARQPSQYLDEEGSGRNGRTRKPPIQILRKYRTDNPDGSITWGYENEDGTFKEETLGINCITTGKYGYIDPDGVRREYKYETGHLCDEPEEEELLPERPQVQPGPQPRKPQFRPAGGQF